MKTKTNAEKKTVPTARSKRRGGLTATQLESRLAPGYYHDGEGLYLRVMPNENRNWLYRYMRDWTAREMGLGPAPTPWRREGEAITLLEARVRRSDARRLLSLGKDPIDERRAEREAMRVKRVADAPIPSLSFEHCMNAVLAKDFPGKTEDNHAGVAQWKSSLRDYGPPMDLPIRDLTVEMMVALMTKQVKAKDGEMKSFWEAKTETATRVRGRIERIWKWGNTEGGNCEGLNPARWDDNLENKLPNPTKLKDESSRNFEAIDYAELPAFMKELAQRDAHSARALEFVIYTAARTGEVTKATWDMFKASENDDGGKDYEWHRPESVMKAGVKHSIPLVPEAWAILKALPRDVQPFKLSENAMLMLIQKRMNKTFTTHGMRSAFSDWARNNKWPRELVEEALAHCEKNKATAAYRRGQALESHRELLEAWALFLKTGKSKKYGS